jgi:putative membrane protein
MNWGYGWWFFPHLWFGGAFSALLWVAVLVAVIYAVRSVMRTTSGRSGDGETPVEILKKRYARGEITKEDFDRIKEDLKD